MSEPMLRFRQSTSSDVIGNRIRIRPAGTVAAYDAPFIDVTPAPAADADGYTRIPIKSLPGADALDGTYDIHVTALDDAPGTPNESAFLELDQVTFDLAPPAAPTDGAIE